MRPDLPFTTGGIGHVVYDGIDIAGHLKQVESADATTVYTRHGIGENHLDYPHIARYVPNAAKSTEPLTDQENVGDRLLYFGHMEIRNYQIKCNRAR